MNKELALRVLDKIVQNPDKWDQECYANKTVCGTKFCFAGHVVHDVYPNAIPNFVHNTDTGTFHLNGELKYYRTVATELLDVNYIAGIHLFRVTNTLDDIRRLINENNLESQNTT